MYNFLMCARAARNSDKICLGPPRVGFPDLKCKRMKTSHQVAGILPTPSYSACFLLSQLSILMSSSFLCHPSPSSSSSLSSDALGLCKFKDSLRGMASRVYHRPTIHSSRLRLMFGQLEKRVRQACYGFTAQRPELRAWGRDKNDQFHCGRVQLELSVTYSGGIHSLGYWGDLGCRHWVESHQHSPR